MAQCKILVDSNSYFRLAKSIRPLLFCEFGEEKCCLYGENEYVDNRKYFPAISRKEKNAIQTAFSFIWEYVQTENLGPSKIDTLYLAHAHILNIQVVTDDDMIAVANVFGIKALKTLELMK